jgi:hypothetical protein
LQFVPAAGVPWFVALFGRDSLIVSLQNALVYPVSLPKIRSAWIRSLSQNHRIIRAEVCDPARAVDLRCRHFQVATQAGSREPVSSSSA